MTVSFVLASTDHGSLIVNRHDQRMVDDRGYGVGLQLLTNGVFDREVVEAGLVVLAQRRQHFGDGVVCVDCGANIGPFTVSWAHQMAGWGSVLAFEPQERLFYALAGNLALNNLSNARALWAAVGAENGSIGVPVLDYDVPSSFGSLELRASPAVESIGQPVDYSRTVTVPMRTIDSLGLARLDLLKVDVEGMELEVLRGALETIERCRPVIIAEHIKVGPEGLVDALRGLGYVDQWQLGIDLLAMHPDDPTQGVVRV